MKKRESLEQLIRQCQQTQQVYDHLTDDIIRLQIGLENLDLAEKSE
jgi:hypothetical protein